MLKPCRNVERVEAFGRRVALGSAAKPQFYSSTLLRSYKKPAASSRAFRKIRLAVAAIDGGAKVMGISGVEMYERLNKQGLVHNRLLGEYEMLHTQSEKWVVQDTVETLKNWEAECKSQEVPRAR